MGKTTKIHCDNCGADLTYTGAMPAFRLCLQSQKIPNKGHAVCDVLVYPPIKQDAYLCNLRCLEDWLRGNAQQP